VESEQNVKSKDATLGADRSSLSYTHHFVEVGHALLFDEKPLADAAAGFTYRFWLERIPRASLLRTAR